MKKQLKLTPYSKVFLSKTNDQIMEESIAWQKKAQEYQMEWAKKHKFLK